MRARRLHFPEPTDRPVCSRSCTSTSAGSGATPARARPSTCSTRAPTRRSRRSPSRGTTTSTPRSAAASAAFQEWSRATPVERSTVLLKAAQLLDERAEELAQLESRQAGKPIRLAREFDVPGTVDNTAFFGTAARRLDGMASAEYSGDHTRSIRREPIGVVGLDRPVELPAADGRLEGAARHRRRQHHRAQARRDHPADQPDPLRRGVHRGRRPRRRRQRRHRHRPGRRPAPRRPPRRRDDLASPARPASVAR